MKKYNSDHKKLRNLKTEALALRKTKQHLFKMQQELLRKFNNKEIHYLSWLFQEMALERFRLKGGWAGADFLYFPMYQEISRRTDINLKDLYSSYRIYDVIKAIKIHKPTVSKEKLSRRNYAHILWLKNRRIYFYSGKQAEGMIKNELKQIQKKEDKEGLHGQIASTGFARGRVRIVISGDMAMLHRAFRDFKNKSIMVTTMTQPNMVPLMKKAAAIVADEGGLVSHAAIMAREFKIPCLVGTEIATKIFKNDDLVEVDANKGIVKLIKRA